MSLLVRLTKTRKKGEKGKEEGEEEENGEDEARVKKSGDRAYTLL